MKIVVTGASGLLGRAVYHHLLHSWQGKNDSTVVGTCFTRKGSSSSALIPYDLTQNEECTRLMQEHKPDVIIHCAAERRPDVVEKQSEKCRQLNVSATKTLATLMGQCGGTMIYISTDYVFDGAQAPYSEDATPNPLNAYGKSKLEGEHEVLEFPRHVVWRVPILYGEVEFVDESAVTVLLPKVLNLKEQCVMSNYERRYPTHCADVATALANFLSALHSGAHPVTDFSGVFHFSAPEEMTKYDMALVMARVFQVASTDHILPDNEPPPAGTQRPYNSKLSCERLKRLANGTVFPQQMIPFATGIKATLEKFVVSHP